MADRVGPVLLSEPVPREHFLNNLSVVTFRAGEPRTTGETHVRWERMGKGMADATLTRLEPSPVDPTDDRGPFVHYAKRSGFHRADAWLDTIRESKGHGEAGELPRGNLYRLTFSAARDPLKAWIRSEGVMVRCEGCDHHVAPYVANWSGYSGDVRTRKGVQGLDISWCAWDSEGVHPDERPEGWEFTVPDGADKPHDDIEIYGGEDTDE